jgi:hypothetical protein
MRSFTGCNLGERDEQSRHVASFLNLSSGFKLHCEKICTGGCFYFELQFELAFEKANQILSLKFFPSQESCRCLSSRKTAVPEVLSQP